jgi:hypothetical protein
MMRVLAVVSSADSLVVELHKEFPETGEDHP